VEWPQSIVRARLAPPPKHKKPLNGAFVVLQGKGPKPVVPVSWKVLEANRVLELHLFDERDIARVVFEVSKRTV
jgi:hypothetical protein